MSNLDSRPEGVRFMRAFREPTSRGLTPEQVVPPMERLTTRGSEMQTPAMTNVRRLNLPPGGFNRRGYHYDPEKGSMHYSLGRRSGFFGVSVLGGVMGLACLIGGPAVAFLTVTTASALSLSLAGPIAIGLATGAVGVGLLFVARDLFKTATGKD